MNRFIYITGISEMQSVVYHVAQITITLVYRDEVVYSTIALILRSLTKYVPNRVSITYNWKYVTQTGQ